MRMVCPFAKELSMPNIFAHACMGRQTRALLPKAHQGRLGEAQQAFDFSLQGSDFFYYYNMAPLRPNTRIAQYGRRIHKTRISPWFRSLLYQCLALDGRQRSTAGAYLAGYLCHYALDTCCHGYICHYCGKSANHTKLETLIDQKLLQVQGIDQKNYAPSQYLEAGEAKTTIAQLYQNALREAHGESVSLKRIQLAMDSFQRFYQKHEKNQGRHYRHYRRLENLLAGGYPLMTRVLMPPESDDRDYLNLSHQIWCKPWDVNDTSDADFLQLTRQACEKAAVYIQALFAAMDCPEKAEEALVLWGDLSLLTGEACKTDLPQNHRSHRFFA